MRSRTEILNRYARLLGYGLIAVAMGILVAGFVFRGLNNLSGLAAFWNFPYDWQWADGDMVALAHRINAGLPIYGDWFKGEVLTIYTPLYFYFIALLDKLAGVNDGHGRQLNLILMALTGLITWAIATFSVSENSKNERKVWTVILAFSALAFMAAPSRIFWPVTWIRPDCLVLFFTALTYLWLLWAERRGLNEKILTPAAAFLSVLAFFSKQSAVGLILSILVYFFVNKRSRVLPFLFWCVSFFGLGTLLVQWAGNPEFVENVFFNAKRLVSSPHGPSLLSWDFAFDLTGKLYVEMALPITIAAIVAGAWRVYRTRRFDLVFTAWIVQGVFTVLLARNSAGGIGYFWPHWMLTCALASQILQSAFDMSGNFSASSANDFNRRAARFATMILLMFATVEKTIDPDGFQKMPAPGEMEIKANEKMVMLLKNFQLGAATPEYLFDHYAGPAVAAGSIPDIEPSSFYYGYLSGQANIKPVLEKIKDRKYLLIGESLWIAKIPEVEQAIRDNYTESQYWTEALSTGHVHRRVWVPKPVTYKVESPTSRGVCGSLDHCDKQ